MKDPEIVGEDDEVWERSPGGSFGPNSPPRKTLPLISSAISHMNVPSVSLRDLQMQFLNSAAESGER